jgi:type IV pilus assembly protein PilB
MISLPAANLKDLLIKENILDGKTFDLLKEEADRKKQNVVDILISQGLLNRDLFISLVAKSLGVPRVNLGSVQIEEQYLKLLPEEIARKRRVVVFGREPDGRFSVAMEDPTDLETIDFLMLKLGAPTKPYLATEEDLDRGFLLYQQRLTQDFKKIIEDMIRESLRLKASGGLKGEATELPIMGLVDNLIAYAISSRASDIHFEVLDDAVLVRYRIDGILYETVRMSKEIHPAVVARIKILSGLRVDEHTHPQDGRFRYKIADKVVDIRVSVIPTFNGEKMELRLLPAAQTPPSFAEIGMFEDTIKFFENAISKSYGMLLVCGPTGSGKTTTLYSLLNRLNRPEVNIITVEDPVEYDMRYVNQVQVNVAAGITFASGLRSILRQDPNIIMVGEVRDSETADISVQAALTGHLVLSSLHTNDSSTAIPRLFDMNIPPFLAAAVLDMISSQRLARRVHIECIESYVPEKGLLAVIQDQFKTLNIDSKATSLPKSFYRGRGCAACNHTGYFGRIAIFEVLNVTEAIRKAIVEPSFSLENLKKVARSEGMITMFEDGLRKVERGLTTIEEVFRVLRE